VTDLVLAFDAACARCRAVAAAVANIGLDVLPLADYRVVAWCAEAGAPTDAPTLLAVTPTDDGDRVRTWSGPRLGPALLAHLGPRGTVRLVRALRAHGVLGDALGGALPRRVRRPSPGRGA
jgi:hypothetical protein